MTDMWVIVSSYSCHSHSDLCNVYPVSLDRPKGKHCLDHYDYDKKNKIKSWCFRFLKDFNLNGLPKIFFVKISLGVHREKSKTDWQQQLSEAGCE